MTDFISYENILNWDCTSNTTALTVSLADKRELVDISCEQSMEINRLLKDYTAVLQSRSRFARALQDYQVEGRTLPLS